MDTPREIPEYEVLWVDDATGEIIRRERRTPQVGPELFGHDPRCSSFIVHFPEGVAEPCDCGKDDRIGTGTIDREPR